VTGLAERLRLYAVTDSRWVGDPSRLPEQVAEAIAGGATAVQFREKERDGGARLLAVAREIAELCRRSGVPFIVNDSLRLAVDSLAAGLHVGQKDGDIAEIARRLPASLILGVSVSTVREALLAEAAGADYLGVGAVFPTGTKADAEPVSKETLKAICRAVTVPVVAIGGITPETVPALAGTGIAGVAAISALFARPDRVAENTARVRTAVEGVRLESRRGITALSVAGSDPVGGAGIQGDLKTFHAHGVHGMAVITSVIAQNTEGVLSASAVDGTLVAEQLEAVFSDIPPDAVKIGLVPNRESALAVGRALDRWKPAAVVADPVFAASSGHRLALGDIETYRDVFLTVLAPRARLVTPNIPEAALLTGQPVITRSDMVRAAVRIRDLSGGGTDVLIKGGHLSGGNSAVDCLAGDGGIAWFDLPRLEGPAPRGTGCALSASLAVNLARGAPVELAVSLAKAALARRIASAAPYGAGAPILGRGF